MKKRRQWQWPAPTNKVHFNPKAMRKLERLMRKWYEITAIKNKV